jgi:hypothetical protein
VAGGGDAGGAVAYHRPWVHYVPVAGDLSDLHQKLGWARRHQTEARAIAERGQAFVAGHLRNQDVLNYWDTLLRGYAARQAAAPQLASGMTLLFDSHRSDSGSGSDGGGGTGSAAADSKPEL